jgi:hypothetical protein
MRWSALIFAGLLLLLGIWTFGWSMSAPESEKAVNWLDYWLNRYQTLITGLLAIAGAGFAIYSAKLPIWYDQKKVADSQDEAWRGTVRALLNAITYSQRVIISKLGIIKGSAQFPFDVFPTVLLDTNPLQAIILSTLKDIPATVGLKCLHMSYSMQFANDMVQGHMVGSTPEQTAKLNLKEGYISHLHRALFSSDIVKFLLLYLLDAPKNEWKEEQFSQITDGIVRSIAKARSVPYEEALVVLKEVNMEIIDDKIAGKPV